MAKQDKTKQVSQTADLSEGANGDFSAVSPSDKLLNKEQRARRLLVVDDDDVDRERIGRYLKKFKLPVVIIDASNGSEAIQQATRDEVDLILLDYQLGDMTGTDVLEKIHQQDSNDIPTIMITGMGDEQTAIEAMRLGVRDYLPKQSLTADSLMQVIESALRTAELEDRLRESQEHLQQLSLYDELTGLANRNLFFDRLQHSIHSAQRHRSTFTLMMIDLNMFKEVNDGMGHQAGDQVLRVIGDRLQSIARKSDTMARMGGDEFVCIMQDIESDEYAGVVAEKIINKISEPIMIDNRVVQIGASIGIAHYPQHGQEASTLLSTADCAMYSAKKANRRCQIYNEQETKSNSRLIAVNQYLYDAIQNDELFMEYQPKIDLHSGELKGVEALVRWQSEELGLLMPGDFIPIAERSSLIEDLTYATIKLVFRDMKMWNEKGLYFPVAINISARMLDSTEFVTQFLDYLKVQQVDPDNISLEITETTLASSGSVAKRMLNDFMKAGIKIGIDDFGRGFTSYRLIREVPFSELKIDRLFVENIMPTGRDAAIVRSITELAECLGAKAVVGR